MGGEIKQVSAQQRADNLYRQALTMLQQGRVAEAQSGLGETLKLSPSHLAARQTLLGILVEARNYAQAQQLLQEGLKNQTQPVTGTATLNFQ